MPHPHPHIPPVDNGNRAIVDVNSARTPNAYFNIVKLSRGQSFDYQLMHYETCIVPATGAVSIKAGAAAEVTVGCRRQNVWDGEPEAFYTPRGEKATLRCLSDHCEIFIAGAKSDQDHQAFTIRSEDIDLVQYGSDDTKTHRKIKHILGQKQVGRVDRLLVSELYTVGAGGWSGFPPHKHDTDRLPQETKHDEIYNFRFRPNHGFGLQLYQTHETELGQAFPIQDGSTFIVDKGYHPCVAAPGYEMYYFTILAGVSQRPLVQRFHPTHAYQVETIPGMKDMIAKFK